MSYIVTVKRIITKSELLAVVGNDDSLQITRQDSQTLDLVWSGGGEESFFQLVQGELQATTPSSPAMDKLLSIASLLGATVVGEEDLTPLSKSTKRGAFVGRSTWIGWPILVLVLGVLLVWRW